MMPAGLGPGEMKHFLFLSLPSRGKEEKIRNN